jgi:hypothetical protein
LENISSRRLEVSDEDGICVALLDQCVHQVIFIDIFRCFCQHGAGRIIFLFLLISDHGGGIIGFQLS